MKTLLRNNQEFHRWYDTHGHGFRLGFVLAFILLLGVSSGLWQLHLIPGHIFSLVWVVLLLILFSRMAYIHKWGE